MKSNYKKTSKIEEEIKNKIEKHNEDMKDIKNRIELLRVFLENEEKVKMENMEN